MVLGYGGAWSVKPSFRIKSKHLWMTGFRKQ